MSNLTVSPAVDAFMSATSQEEMRIAAGIEYTEPHFSKARIATPFSLTADANSWTLIPLDTIESNVSNLALNPVTKRIVCLRSGWYRISTSGALKGVTTMIPRIVIRVEKHNGQGVYQGALIFRDRANYLGRASLSESLEVYLNTFDELNLAYFKDSAGSVAVEDSGDYYQPAISIFEMCPRPITPLPYQLSSAVGYGDSQMAGTLCGAQNVAGKKLFHTFLNRGVPGRTSQNVLDDHANITADNNPNAVFILQVGINDGGFNVGMNPNTTAANIMAIMGYASGHKDRVWITPGVADYSDYANNAGLNSFTTDLVAAVLALNPPFKILRLDQDSKLGMAANPKDLRYMSDGLHYTEISQRIIATKLAAIL